MSARPPKRGSDPALAKIEEAYTRFKDTVSPTDARQFDNAKLQDVWDAAKVVEKKLSEKRACRNLRWLHPLLTGLGHYSDALGVLCNGTPYLPWVWAPIKLFLQVASDYLSAFETLIKAYSEIADALPRFDRLANALKDKPDFPTVLTVFYCDILDFHRRAYKFFRTSSWKRFFDSSWGRFDIRFKGIIEDLKYHAELVDKEANVHNIVSTEEWRQRQLEEIKKSEARRAEEQFHAVLSWLDIKDYINEDRVDNLVDQSHAGTTEWLLDHSKVKTWISRGGQAWLWLNGKPGSGKSVLCAQVIRRLQIKQTMAMCYFMCDFRSAQSNTCSYILRTFVRQVLKRDQSLAPFVYDEYVLKAMSPSKEVVKQLLPILLEGLDSSRIVLDGLDECLADEQNQVLSALRFFVDRLSDNVDCKVAIFSRDITMIQKKLERCPTISLKVEHAALDRSIRAFVHHQIEAIRPDLEESYVEERVYTNVERKIVSKADGMFLWVRLVLDTLRDLQSAYEIEKAVDDLPSGLEQAYGRIVQLIKEDQPRGSFKKIMSAFSLIAYAQRPLKAYEILHGILLCTIPLQTSISIRLPQSELDKLKPLVEIDATGHVSFVHFTVKEFLFDPLSGPFLVPYESMHSIAHACVCCVQSGLDLADPKLSERDKIINIALGHQGLHRYATTYWLHHLEQLSQACEKRMTRPANDLVGQLTDLQDRHSQLELATRVQVAEESISLDEDSARFRAFKDMTKIFDFVSQASSYSRQADQRLSQSVEDTSAAVNVIPTLLLEASERHDTIVERLLAATGDDGFPDLPLGTVRDFKIWYGHGAFPCRFRTCIQHSKGFRNEKERNVHEQTHLPRLFCSETSCPFATSIGFRNAKALHKHTREMHTTNSSLIPEFRKFGPSASNENHSPHRNMIPESRRRSTGPKVAQYGEEDQNASEETMALLQSTEVRGGHDALKRLFEAASLARDRKGAYLGV